ncbi:unnamed protein product [Hydatigera taeniaeformis]|uniref:Seryl_tRNA_N domain-containing protein n=1 Tax=Hydatigena taeniaeformis TaxID=6205 RepID=A0A0R3WKY1_HYDTA|nr:unnamed protein product [Hydatigera taeniaeformis]
MLIWQVFWRKLTTPAFKSAVLPTGSTLHRISERFTPSVEAQPDFNATALTHSVQRRGLANKFNRGFFEHVTDQTRVVRSCEEKIKRLEIQRQNLHMEFQEASKMGDGERQDRLRAASKRVKEAKNRCSQLRRTISFKVMEDLLKLPNKLRETESALPSESWFGHSSKCTVLSPGAIRTANLDNLIVYKDCGTFFTGQLATFTQEMSSLLTLLGREVKMVLGSTPRRCALSDLVRLPVAEACAWTPSLDEVIQLEHTKDDVFIPKEGGQTLINPYTRLCLVGSASLAAFVGTCHCGSLIIPIRVIEMCFTVALPQGSFFGCCLDKECPLPLRFLTLGNIYTYGKLRAVPAEELRRCEMSLWSLALVESGKPDIELASFSLLGDWVSRRAGFKTFDNSFPFMVIFRICNSPMLLLPARIGALEIKG